MAHKFEKLRNAGSLDAKSLAQFGISPEKLNKIMNDSGQARPNTASSAKAPKRRAQSSARPNTGGSYGA